MSVPCQSTWAPFLDDHTIMPIPSEVDPRAVNLVGPCAVQLARKLEKVLESL